LPQRPSNQSERLTILSSAALAGLLIGLLIAGLLEMLDSSFRSEEEALKTLSIPVLAQIPTMSSAGESRKARLRARLMDAGGAVVVAAAVVVVVFWQLRS
jgi:hypothetical protein